MFFLLGSIILTSYLTLSFKVVERFRINTFQTIVFNYWACVITGSLFNRHFPITTSTLAQPWFKWALLMGTIFISLFNIIGVTAQKIGVSVASVANKLSLVIPFVFSLYLYHEKLTLLKLTGVVLALAAVVLICMPAKAMNDKKIEQRGPGPWWMKFLPLVPLILFIGSGLLDTMVKYVEQHFLNDSNTNDYLIAAFASAGSIGVILLLILLVSGKQHFDYRSIFAGFVIGIPNYFSIWCLMVVLKKYAGNSSAILPINNMGIVLFSALMAGWLFKEKLSLVNWSGIILSLVAIALIAF